MSALHILIVEPDRFLRSGFQAVLERTILPRSSVEAREELPEAPELSPFNLLYLSDARYSRQAFPEIVRHIHARYPTIRIVVLSQRLNTPFIQQVFRSGVLGYIYMRDDLDHSLNLSVSTVCRDLVYLSPRVAELLTTETRYVAGGDLNDLDRQILQMTAHDFTVRQISRQLGISDRSVYRSKAKIREMLDVQNTDNIIDAARRQGLLEEDV